MIIGQVNPQTEAIIPVFIYDSDGQIHSTEAAIDTGFSGYLSLPLSLITTWDLAFIETRPYSLGNNQRVDFDLYGAIIIWDGQEREILVLASEAYPLVGMSLLKGYNLSIDVIDGGEVRIERRL